MANLIVAFRNFASTPNNQNTHFMFNIFFPKNLWDIVGEYGRAGQDTDYNIMLSRKGITFGPDK